MTASIFWISVSVTLQVLMIKQEVRCGFAVNYYRSKPDIFLRHDLQQLNPMSELYVVVPQSSQDDASSPALNQPSWNQAVSLPISQKRYPIFVGRRSDDSNEEVEDWTRYGGGEDKRAKSHLFVGRRAPPIFVGKKAIVDLDDFESKRRKRRSITDASSTSDTKDATAASGQAPNNAVESKQSESKTRDNKDTEKAPSDILNAEETKRARLFVGKREEYDASESDKRSRMFVGKRDEEEVDNSESKRSRMFVGRRSEAENQISDDENKRSRMFVGKRPYYSREVEDNLEDIENEDQQNEDKDELQDEYRLLGKKSRLFVGKRLPKFVGKRAPKFVGKRFGEEDSSMEKRSRMFVGKRSDEGKFEEEEEKDDIDNDMDEEKRSRMFVGKRESGISPKFYFGKRREDDQDNTEMFESDKKSRMFVGKKSDQDFENDDEKRAPKFVGKRPFSYTSDNSELENDSIDDIKRTRMFVGKRPAPGFVGKRPAPGFVGKRPAPGFVGKRPAPGFVGKRPAPGFVGKRPAPGFVGKRPAPGFVGK